MSSRESSPDITEHVHEDFTRRKRSHSSSPSGPQCSKKHRRETSDEIALISEDSNVHLSDILTNHASPSNNTDDPASDKLPGNCKLQFLEFHCVECKKHLGHATAFYDDCPRLFKNDSKPRVLRGRNQVVSDIFSDEKITMATPPVSFIVVKYYDCGSYHEKQIVKEAFRLSREGNGIEKALSVVQDHLILETDGPEAVCTHETIYPIAEELKSGIAHLEGFHPQYEYIKAGKRGSMTSPYIDIYHMRKFLKEQLTATSQVFQEAEIAHLKLLVDRILVFQAQEFQEADQEFSNGFVTKPHFNKLFALNEMVVQRTADGPIGLVVIDMDHTTAQEIKLRVWSWGFDGKFFKKETTIVARLPSTDGQVSIRDLGVFPLRLSGNALKQRLTKRGKEFWRCRKRRLVEYNPLTTDIELQASRYRYMIDFEAYNQMHPDDLRRDHEVWIELDSDIPPDGSFLQLLPATIRGYGFHDKKWVKLFVEGISDVEWNTDVFKHQLVMKQQKKDLIEALVTVHSSSSLRLQKTDVIERKAKGLIILLHGSPGTGKTLTAESIAEYTHRPLYRLNAGDIGVDPESVEKYLEVVFYLGTLWNCVVLLDEADVFLEERAATDLQRNALVASFLRILEYFEGVLVLTSNRVGVFDEAFQSRVQLAIYYPPLDSDSRFEIWKTFFDVMLGSDEKNKQREIERKLGFLANQKMNGRQIRNVFNTARQLARFKKEDLSYSHIEQALDVAKEFQDYITATHGHTDEEFAKEGRLR